MTGVPSDLIDRARRTPIEAVVRERGLKLKGRAERVGPCPRCGGTDRFGVNAKKQVFNCRGCGAKGGVIALVMFLDGCDFRTAIKRLSGEGSRPIRMRKPAGRAGDDEARRLKRDLASAARIASAIVPLFGTPGETYLRDIRKIDVAAIEDVMSRTDAIGWHPGVYFNEPGHALNGQRLGSIIGVMTDSVTAQPTGAISRIYLGPDLMKIGKAKTLGAPMGIIRLSPDDEVLEGLWIAEGLETALAGMAIGLRPIWSTGSSGLMASFPVLSGIEALTVVVDHDLNGAGERAAREVEARWLAAGKEVRLKMSDALGDLNDALKGGFS